MKIGILVYKMVGIGGVQRITAEKINAWIEIFGYDLVLITKNELDSPFFYEINKKCKLYNLNIQAKLSGGLKQYIKNIPKAIKLSVELKRILELENIDVLITTMISIDSLVIPFVKSKIPKISEIHGSGFSYNKKGWFLKKLIINRYKKIVVLNKSEVEYFPLNNIAVIPNFTDISNYDNLKHNKKNIIISAGRISWEKQFDHLVDIWSVIASKHPNWEVHIYGSSSADGLKRKIDAMDLRKSFKIFPATTEIKEKMQEASIFALVSATEAFPMVLLEAMSAELPIVSYDSPNGPRNIVTDGKDGFIVPLNDKVAFSEKLDLLISNPKIREDFVQNQKSKLDLFSKERVMNQWNDLILALLDKKSKKSFSRSKQ